MVSRRGSTLGRGLRPWQDERLDLAECPHALDRVVDAVQGIARGQHGLEVVARTGAAHELERLPELADVGRLHAQYRRPLAHEEGGLHGREWPAELADHRVAATCPEKVEALRERVGSAGQLEDHVGATPVGELAHAYQ